MLQICCRLNEIDVTQLFTVYAESIAEDGRERMPWGTEYEQIAFGQQNFYEYLIDFFRERDAFYALWIVGGQYRSALRMEPYRDGYLLCGLETSPNSRRNGYGTSLVSAVIEHLGGNGPVKIYTHVDKQNNASLSLHANCGFRRIKEHAVCLDGSVLHSSCTLMWTERKNAT